jgi:hypothetical protein
MIKGSSPKRKEYFLSKYQFTSPLKLHCIGILSGNTGKSKSIKNIGIINIRISFLQNFIFSLQKVVF